MMDERNFAKNEYYECTYDEYVLTHCSSCARKNCPHRWAFRRYPESMGGLGLCPNLKEGEANDKNRKSNND